MARKFLLTQKDNTFKNFPQEIQEIPVSCQLRQIHRQHSNFLATFISCKRLWSRADHQTPRNLSTYQLFMVTIQSSAHYATSTYQVTAAYFQIEAEKNGHSLTRTLLLIYPVFPQNPHMGKA